MVVTCNAAVVINSVIVDTGFAAVDLTITLDDSNSSLVVTGIVTVNETSALHDYGNGEVVTSFALNVS